MKIYMGCPQPPSPSKISEQNSDPVPSVVRGAMRCNAHDMRRAHSASTWPGRGDLAEMLEARASVK